MRFNPRRDGRGSRAAQDGPTHDCTPARGLRGADRRHRRLLRDAHELPRVRLLGDLPARPARRARRSQARAAAHPLLDERDGPASRPGPRQVLPRRRRRDGQAPPARRQRHLRRPRPAGAAVLHAAAPRRRPRQLRLPRRPPGRHALHRGQAGPGRDAHGRVARRGHRRLQAQLRRPGDRAHGHAVGVPQPPGQRHHRHRRRHGHQYGAAQPHRGRRRRPAPDQEARRHARRAHAVRAGPRPADRRHDHRPAGHPRRLRDGARHVPDARQVRGRADHAAPQGHHRHRAALQTSAPSGWSPRSRSW